MTVRDVRTIVDGSEPLAAVPSDVDLALVGPSRYELGEGIGRGASGRVLSAHDKVAGRLVALKVLSAEHTKTTEMRTRFVHEARVTAALEHPSIVPVHDLGITAEGTPYYAMRIVERRTLRGHLDETKERDPATLTRLVQNFLAVCRGVEYAHVRGVVHRDLKPENVLLGSFGEVYVADWGIAKVLAAPEVLPERQSSPPEEVKGLTRGGSIMGTPGYMPPEQIASSADVDARADIFALGAILYEILTGTEAFGGKNLLEVFEKTQAGKPLLPRAVVPTTPLVLEDLCLSMLRPSPDARPQRMTDVVGEVEAYLEGARESDRRRVEARRLSTLALSPAARYVDLGREHESLVAYAKELAREVKPWEPVEKKRTVWTAEDEARAADIARASALAEAMELFTQALAYDSRSREARDGLASLYAERAREAEEQKREAERLLYEQLMLEYDDGTHATRMRADARLFVDVEGHGARVTIARFVEKDRRLVATNPRALGEGPRVEARVQPGSWLVTVTAPGRAEARLPVVCRRGEEKKVRVTLFAKSDVPDGFVHVPAGEGVVGGDAEAFDALPRRVVTTPDLAFGVYSVTMGEYLAWCDELVAKGDEAEAKRRAPQSAPGDSDGQYAKLVDGKFVLDADLLVEGDGKQYVPKDQLPRLPVMGISWWDAMAYARWRSAKERRKFRLPTEAEWERAARGPDARLFPWGDASDATFTKARESRPTFSQPEPVGAFASDESPFGVRDMAGTVRNWVLDVHGSLTREQSEAEPEPSPGAARADTAMRCTRGGSWYHAWSFGRAATRYLYFSSARFSTVGFRLVVEL